MKPKHSACGCWICNGEYEYYFDENYEELGYYSFKCKKCGEIVITPKENPTLEFIED